MKRICYLMALVCMSFISESEHQKVGIFSLESNQSLPEKREIKTIVLGDKFAIIADKKAKKGMCILKKNNTIFKYDMSGKLLKKSHSIQALGSLINNDITTLASEVSAMKIKATIECNAWSLDSYSAKCSLEACKWYNCFVDSNECDCEGGDNETSCRSTMCFYCLGTDGCPTGIKAVTRKDYVVNIRPLKGDY